MQRTALEVAVDTIDDGIAAARTGADRLEVCADLGSHGFTADAAALASLVAAVRLPVVAMVRARGPGFMPGRPDFAAMLDDAQRLLAAGAAGIVFGLVTPEGMIDVARVQEVVRTCSGRQAVFHRAFDLLPDPAAAAGRLADLGVTRVLSAGQTPEEAADALGLRSRDDIGLESEAFRSARLRRIRTLVEAAGSRIEVLAGGGVRAHNAGRVLRETGCAQLHSSCRDGDRFDANEVRRLRAVLDAPRFPSED